jgi:hypothetical protein
MNIIYDIYNFIIKQYFYIFTKHYYQNTKIQEINDDSCIVYPNGRQEWWLNGNLHREDGPAIIFPDGTQSWWLSGNLHREDGPAVIHSDGTKVWFLNGDPHREDGPAIIWSNGYQEWWINGKHITKEVNDWAKERNVDLNNMSDVDKMILQTEIKMWK